MRVGLGRDQDTLQAGQGRLALTQTQPERCRLTGPGALTLGDLVPRHRPVLARHLHHDPPLHCAPASPPSQRPLPSSPRFETASSKTQFSAQFRQMNVGANPYYTRAISSP